MSSVCNGINVFVACWRKSLFFPGICHVEGPQEPYEKGNILQINKKEKKKKKKQVFLLGVGFLLPNFPLKLELLCQGKVSARCAGHLILC